MKHDKKIAWIVVDQIRTIDKQRIVKVLGRLSESEKKELKSIIKDAVITVNDVKLIDGGYITKK